MKVLDYRNSFVINTSAKDGVEMNTCRSQVLASCTLTDIEAGQSWEYYLGKECIGEHMYEEIGIAQVPTAEVCVLFGKGESSLQKKFANHDSDVVQSGPTDVPRKGFAGGYAYWTDLQFKLRTATARPLPSTQGITAATLAGEAIVGRTELSDPERGWKATLGYPVCYINVHPPDGRFQVDVGPVLYPDLASTAALVVDRLRLAYVMYNQLDAVEFALRAPTAVVEGQAAATLHYAEVVKESAPSALFSLSD